MKQTLARLPSKTTKSQKEGQKGFITIDFIFALVIVSAFFSIMFGLSVTLSVVEITQYITFATARNYYAAHWDISNQEQNGQTKYRDLTENEVISPLFNNGWFELTAGSDGGIGDYNDLYDQGGEDSANFIGSRVQLNAKVLEFRFPLIGATYDDENSFVANVASYLNREPTSVECLNFMQNGQRFRAIQGLDASYSAAPFGNYQVMADNGC